jgi:hypothetical protein
MRKQISLTIILLCLSVFGQVHAVSFTADAVQIRGESVSKAKMFWRDGNVRFEYEEDGVPMAQIFDNKNHTISWLDLKNKFYLKREMSAADQLAAENKASQTDDPCKQFVNAECVLLKKTTMNGRKADKWLITLHQDGRDLHIFQWVDQKYKNILRQENWDGSGLSVEIEENQQVNGREVRKLTMTAFNASGAQQQGTQWYDNKLDIVVKQQYQSEIIDELKNIKVQQLSAALFDIPDDYLLYEDAIKTAQQDTRPADTEAEK